MSIAQRHGLIVVDYAQFEKAVWITQDRLSIWNYYHELLKPLASKGMLRCPIVPDGCQHNAHMYYVLLNPEIDRQRVLDEFKHNDIWPVFHYVPLHSSPAGQRYGKMYGALDVTNRQSERLIRLPLWIGMTKTQQKEVVDLLSKFLS